MVKSGLLQCSSFSSSGSGCFNDSGDDDHYGQRYAAVDGGGKAIGMDGYKFCTSIA